MKNFLFLLCLTCMCTHIENEFSKSTIIAVSSEQNPRNSEGDLAVLPDGSLLVVYSMFTGGWGDMSVAHLAESRSFDNGQTWTVSKPVYIINDTNVMSASLLRLNNGKLALFFLIRDPERSHQMLDIMMMTAKDSLATEWETPVKINSMQGYHVVNNARVFQTKNNRIIVPFALTDDIEKHFDIQKCGIYYSDDAGKTWNTSKNFVELPDYPLMEPGIEEKEDGSLLMNIRTDLDYVYFSESVDNGLTWSAARVSKVKSPSSPATVTRIPNNHNLMIVHNPVGSGPWRNRTPLAASFSSDDGKTWSPPVLIESDTTFAYAYVSITWQNNDALLTYYKWPRNLGKKNFQSTDLIFKRLPESWFQEVFNLL